MGCGSSSLKGEKVDTANSQPVENPMKRVQTNFSDVDFAGDGNGARRGKSFAMAPDETRRPTRISETNNEDIGPDGQKLAPYKTIDGDGDLANTDAKATVPKINLPPSDPTSEVAKDAYASANQPINETSAHHDSLPASSITEAAGERKKSWYARAQDRFTGRNISQISDEDIKRVFGMTRPEWEAYMNDPKNQVGPHAKPENMPHMGMSTGMMVDMGGGFG